MWSAANSPNEPVITGVGVVSPLGIGKQAFTTAQLEQQGLIEFEFRRYKFDPRRPEEDSRAAPSPPVS